MNTPLVSVIIPCFNAAQFIDQTISSVLSQSYYRWELIVIDDGSTDNSADLIKKYVGQDDRILYLYQENQGVSVARNKGIKRAKGDIISFLDADDIFLPNNLENKVNYLQSHDDILLVHSWEEVFVTESGDTIEIAKGQNGSVLNSLLELSGKVVHSPSSVVIRKELINLVGDFDPQLSTSADWEMWVRMAPHTSFGLIPETLVKYRKHSGQMHLDIDRMDIDMHFAFKKTKDHGLFKSKEYYAQCYANLLMILGASFLGDQKNYQKGALYLLKSLRLKPMIFFKKLMDKVAVLKSSNQD